MDACSVARHPGVYKKGTTRIEEVPSLFRRPPLTQPRPLRALPIPLCEPFSLLSLGSLPGQPAMELEPIL